MVTRAQDFVMKPARKGAAVKRDRDGGPAAAERFLPRDLTKVETTDPSDYMSLDPDALGCLVCPPLRPQGSQPPALNPLAAMRAVFGPLHQ